MNENTYFLCLHDQAADSGRGTPCGAAPVNLSIGPQGSDTTAGYANIHLARQGHVDTR